MKKQNLFRLMVAAACLAVVPLLVSAAPGGTPPTGNVDANFSTVTSNNDTGSYITGVPSPYGGGFSVTQTDGTAAPLGDPLFNAAGGLGSYAQSNSTAYAIVGWVNAPIGTAGNFANITSGTLADLANGTSAGLFSSSWSAGNPALDTLIATTDGFSMVAPQQVQVGSHDTALGINISPTGVIKGTGNPALILTTGNTNTPVKVQADAGLYFQYNQIIPADPIKGLSGVRIQPDGFIHKYDKNNSEIASKDLFTGGYGKYVGPSVPTVADPLGFDGNLGATATKGYAGARGICALKYAGSHVCTAGEITNSYELDSAGAIAGAPAVSMWINNGPPAYISDLSNDCNGWKTNAASGTYGSVWNFAGTNQYSKISLCNRKLQFACCSY